jgi:hypothetical protein
MLCAQRYGRKRWAVLPPKDAQFSQKPALQFFAEDVPDLRNPSAATTDARFHRPRGDLSYEVHDVPGAWELYEFTQHAGDLVFLPDFWGHATLNLETSVGMALEMENFNDGAYAVTPAMIRRVLTDHPDATFGFPFPQSH